MKKQEYKIIMFYGDAIVEGSMMTVSDKELIKKYYEYAIYTGYTFSSKKIK